jgi:hypothetical protein
MAKTNSSRAHGNDIATERKHYGVRRPFFPQSSSIRNESAKNNFFPGNLIQRMCSECQQEEEKVQRAPKSGSVPVYHGAEDGLAKSAGKGSGLPKQTLGEMSSSFGNDFSSVRIHTDSEATRLNNQFHAQAFTHGNDIYFNKGKYDPHSTSGKHLLAHELTHVVQQHSNTIQRKPISGDDLTSTTLAGDPILEETFDNEALVSQSHNPDGEHVRRIQEGLLNLGFSLYPNDADSHFDEGTASAVRDFQLKASMSVGERDGIVGRKTLGLLDRSLRNDQVSTDVDAAAEDFVVNDPKKDTACDKGEPTLKDCDDETSPPTRKTIKSAVEAAIAVIDKVLAEQLPPKKTDEADYPVLFNRIFRNNDTGNLQDKVDEVKKNFEKIRKHLKRLNDEEDLSLCGTLCDGACRSGVGAYQQDGSITFCPAFETKPDRQVILAIHESHHAAISGSSDFAYAITRLFDKLDHKKALLNAASFHAYAVWVDKPGSESIGPEVKDSNFISDEKQKKAMDLCLAFLEQWLILAKFDLSSTLGDVREARRLGYYNSASTAARMESVFAKWFGLTPPPAPPVDRDVEKLLAIEERVVLMFEAFESPFVILETDDVSHWARGPGMAIALNNEVLKLGRNPMTIALLQELVHATPGISADSEALYVGAINAMRRERKLDPQ